MRPVFYSELNAKKNKIGWVRGGSNIRYYRNNLGSREGRTFYGLTWTCNFPFKDDSCYFAHCFPYTYTDLQEYLLDLANDPVRSRFCKQRVLCRTLAGNLVYILTITSPSRNPEISRAKRAVVLTARVHPGETNASWMMKGFLDYLSGSSADAKLLRDTFIFKIVPMLNPDGVIVGNYR
uniref:Peptidase M14 domain-containing protein n=1 Tax=Ciona savignyi TaxID=51511 RepID=H2Y3W5_CIOSA